MNRPVIRVENLAKQYRLGKIGTGTLTHDLNRWWHLVRGKEDPYLKIGETNDRTIKGDSQYVWSLRDINFDINQGDAVGIIGRNGAGKSTLLKILSRTTTPTKGSVKIKGRVASLLEVGTGFHPELSGRENIFLNGAILGMTKNEIKRKFDEIVDFAGVERYVDTPVKRYSSGMYVRLAFGVAAHLEPDILIVDEVLAVGDAEFQKKAIGKMKDVSEGDGRTVIFVSHNMDAVNSLCDKGIFLQNGLLKNYGNVNDVIQEYLNVNNNTGFVDLTDLDNTHRKGKRMGGEILSVGCYDSSGEITGSVFTGEELFIRIRVRINEKIYNPEVGICFSNNKEVRLQHLVSKWDKEFGVIEKGEHVFEVKLHAVRLYPGSYPVTAWFRSHVKGETDDFVDSALKIEVVKSKVHEKIDFGNFQSGGGVLAEFSWNKFS